MESVDKEISLWLSGIPVSIWNAINHWGLKTGKLSIHKRTTAQNIAVKIRSARPFTELERQNGAELIQFIMETAPELFDETVQEFITESNVATEETNNLQEIITEAATIDAAVWIAAARWGKSTGKLDKFGQSLCYSLGYLAQKGNLPSIRQATHGLRVLASAKERGFVKPS